MNNKEFTAILQVALWKNEGIDEVKIRQLLPDFNDNIIKSGIKFCEYLQAIK